MLKIPDNIEVHDFPTSRIWIKDGIVYAVSNGTGTNSLEEAKELLSNFRELIGNNKICLLIDVSESGDSPREVRDFVAEEFPKFVKAIAMLSDSALGKMLANLFFAVKDQPYPTKFFNDEEEAREWLLQYV